jgi:5-methylcytosine-specific restriction protein A
MTVRRRISTRERMEIFTREKGACHLCQGAIVPGVAWDISHDIPLELGGDDHGLNLKIAHRNTCHREHTRKVDVPAIAKAKRREAAHLGAKQPSGKLQGAQFPKKPKPEKLPIPPRIHVAGQPI